MSPNKVCDAQEDKFRHIEDGSNRLRVYFVFFAFGKKRSARLAALIQGQIHQDVAHLADSVVVAIRRLSSHSCRDTSAPP